MPQCRICKSPMEGRTDKKFCSSHCKNVYHSKLRQVTDRATKSVDVLLHRNRAILLEFLGKNGKQKKVNKSLLEKKNFQFQLVTGYHLNTRNKMVNYVYDFSWSIFSDRQVLITRLRQ